MYIYSNEIECFTRVLKTGIRDKDFQKALARFERAYSTSAQGSGCKCFSIWTSILVSLSLADRTDLWTYEHRFQDLDDLATQDRVNNLGFAIVMRMRYLMRQPSSSMSSSAIALVLQLAYACEGDI